jgi:hypothetical protein
MVSIKSCWANCKGIKLNINQIRDRLKAANQIINVCHTATIFWIIPLIIDISHTLTTITNGNGFSALLFKCKLMLLNLWLSPILLPHWITEYVIHIYFTPYWNLLLPITLFYQKLVNKIYSTLLIINKDQWSRPLSNAKHIASLPISLRQCIINAKTNLTMC